MKLKFRYVFFILLSRSFISADSVRAVDSDTETVSSFISADRVRAVDSDTETVIHNALVDVLSLELGVRYPNVPWSPTHRRRFAGLTDERKACLLNTCDAEKCEAVLSHFQFQALTQCSMREFKNLLRFPLDVVRNLMYSLRHDPQRYHPFVHLNDDELNVLLGFPSSRILKFTRNPEEFSLILKVGLNYFRPLNDDQFNNVFRLFSEDIKELKRFAFEHIPVLLETENLEKTKTILHGLRRNFQASQMLEPQTTMRFLHLPLDAVKKLMHTFNPQRHGPFLHLNDDEFNEFKKFSTDRMEALIGHGEILPDILKLGLEQVRDLTDDQFNNVLEILPIKKLKSLSLEDILVLLKTENLEKTKTILHCLRSNSQVSQILEIQSIMQLLHLPLNAVTRVTCCINIDSQPHPFLHLNDNEFTTLRGFSDDRIIQFASNPKVFSSLLDVGLKSFQPLHDDQFNNVFKILSKNDIKELKRFTPEHIPVLLETENLEKTETILYCLRTNYEVSQTVETKPIMQLLHLPLDAVRQLMYSYPQLHGPFVHLNDDEFNEFKKFSTDRMKTLIGHGEILPDILKLGLEQVRDLTDDQFNNVLEILPIKKLKNLSLEDILVLLKTENLEKTKTILHCVRSNSQVSQILEIQSIMQLLHLPLNAVTRVTCYINIDSQPHPFLHLNDNEFTTLRGFSDDRTIQFARNPQVFSSLLDVGLKSFQPLHDDQLNNVFQLSLKDIKELKRFTPEHIPVLLETENLEKTETILYCLRTKPQASQMLEPQTTMRFLHLPLDAVKKLMHTFDPQRHGPFVHLNDDEFNEFKKFSTDRMRTLIDYSKILPDILKFGLEKVRNLPDDEFNTLINRTLDQVEQLR